MNVTKKILYIKVSNKIKLLKIVPEKNYTYLSELLLTLCGKFYITGIASLSCTENSYRKLTYDHLHVAFYQWNLPSFVNDPEFISFVLFSDQTPVCQQLMDMCNDNQININNIS